MTKSKALVSCPKRQTVVAEYSESRMVSEYHASTMIAVTVLLGTQADVEHCAPIVDATEYSESKIVPSTG